MYLLKKIVVQCRARHRHTYGTLFSFYIPLDRVVEIVRDWDCAYTYEHIAMLWIKTRPEFY